MMGGRGGWRERPITNVSGTFDQPLLRTDGRTDGQTAGQSGSRAAAGVPPTAKPANQESAAAAAAADPRIRRKRTKKKKKSNTLLLWLQTQTGQGRLPLGLRPRLSTDDQSDSETHSRGRHSDVAPGRRRGNWDTAEKPAGPDTSGATRPRHDQRKPFGSDTSSWRSI